MKNILFISLMLSLTVAFSHASQMYKWVDENGQTQFSQFPPSATSQSEQIKVEAPKSRQSASSKEKLDNMRQKLLENSVGRGEKERDKEEQDKKKEELARACTTSKKRLKKLQENGRVYTELENGERKWFDVKERDGLIKDAQQDVADYCSK
jgi:Skp family chaperone for outer membrane proteins